MKKNDKNLLLIEVSPRDGIQIEKTILSTEDKLELIERAIQTGIKQIEVTSFVNPARVPQMYDADALALRLPRGSVRYSALALNMRGFDRALAAGVDEVNFVVLATETFNQRNQGVAQAETLETWGKIGKRTSGRLALNLTIGASFGCPFEGEVSLERLLQTIRAAVDSHSPDILTLADTIGVATPYDIQERIALVQKEFPELPLRLHLHNTRNTGIANVWAGYQAGVTSFDVSIGGVGGCPFAPRATGNVATEDVIYLFERANIPTGVDIGRTIDAALWLETRLGHQLPSMLMKAGPFITA